MYLKHFKIAGLAARLTLILLLAAALPLHAGTIAPELLYRLELAAPNEEIPVIVTLADRVDIRQFTEQTRKTRRARMIRELRERFEQNFNRSGLAGLLQSMEKGISGGARVRRLWIINGLAFKARPALIRSTAKRPWVETVRMDGTVSLPIVETQYSGLPEWNLTAINAPALWDLGYTGQGVVVANIDSGVDLDHPDLIGRWRGGSNSWFDANNPDNIQPYDSAPDGFPHGTATMGIMVGGDAGGTVIGVAPGAQWIAVKIFNESNIALESEIHAGFEWLLDPDKDPETDDAPDVVNNSWGFEGIVDQCFNGSTEGESFRIDIQILKQAGIAVVFSAGNRGALGYNTSVSPANYPESFSVGAVDETPAVADFSSRGPSACAGDETFPDIVAPGDRFASPFGILTAIQNDGIGTPYDWVQGTSVAAPHAAGAMALLLSAFPELTPEQLEDALKTSAFDLGEKGIDNDSGYGLIDVMAAYQQIADVVTITRALYLADGRLVVEADSSARSDAKLTAFAMIGGSSVDLGNVFWRATLGYYRSVFTGVGGRPTSVTVISSGGGSATWAADVVTITRTSYLADGRLVFEATSSVQPDAKLNASAVVDDSNVDLGRVYWRDSLGYYRSVFASAVVGGRPTSVTVTSSGGGMATAAVQ